VGVGRYPCTPKPEQNSFTPKFFSFFENIWGPGPPGPSGHDATDFVSLHKIVGINPLGSAESKKITETCFAVLIYQNHKLYILKAQTQSNKVASLA